MRSSNRAAAVVELFVRAVFAELRAQRTCDGALTCDGSLARASREDAREPTINVWRGGFGGLVH